ncbi:MAG TPA: efflux RND transporter periplasmic adaptor subunit [Candidatus Bathyarchaeia archaeon]|nr:efflux RND transporter periplasmic adaptor subunit [Candidatus Bathyarchaeia archaeon]
MTARCRAFPIAALAALLSVASACNRQDAGGAEQTAAGGAPSGLTAEQLSFLKFGRVTEVGATDLTNLSGTIDFDEQHTSHLHSPVAGRVAELLVQVGDRIAADQPLIAIDSPEVRAAQADYVHVTADLLIARKAGERAERLKAAEAISVKDYLQARADAEKAEADVARAQAELDRLRVKAGDSGSRYLLRSPFAGTVVERKASVGMETGPESGDPLVVVSDLSRVRVVVRVPERQLGLVHQGQEVRVHVDAYPSDFSGEVDAIGDVVEDATQTIPVRCVLPNPDHLLKPAMFARVALKAPGGVHLLTVPAAAVLSDGQRYRVIVRTGDGRLEQRYVEVGADLGAQVQVLSGVAAGEEIVTEGAIFAAHQLFDS